MIEQTFNAEADKAFDDYVAAAFKGAQVGRVGVQQLRYAFKAGWLRSRTSVPTEELPQWISVNERRPVHRTDADGEQVALLISDRSCAIENWVTTGYRHCDGSWWGGHPGKYVNLATWEVTHWTRLPAMPSPRGT